MEYELTLTPSLSHPMGEGAQRTGEGHWERMLMNAPLDRMRPSGRSTEEPDPLPFCVVSGFCGLSRRNLVHKDSELPERLGTAGLKTPRPALANKKAPRPGLATRPRRFAGFICLCRWENHETHEAHENQAGNDSESWVESATEPYATRPGDASALAPTQRGLFFRVVRVFRGSSGIVTA